ncbi:pyridoxal-dependent decarboxylase domain-containing protein 1 isoform X2 [Leguminivora glycinivorella]|uniref:pyridoxal-dependent decarboxylase domain-containing protein 1 isoform X1 n=1 Tax=Leguminivora glycinivorella TaxID=1035111 RepID=UPI0020106F84|nr:pyridoxal-dependent decarboxylase domain-containing protein 1 isoform X1 [Leguminivora glycinivorella]XP_047994846.1 pyridoxal-dependent decarboxylase domain-containing protein 1 isoform X2 [Leguminivora glycinivorella]
MGDASVEDTESNKHSPQSEAPSETDRGPFGGLEFQVSEVVERLEAGVNAHEAGDDERRREPRKISAGFFEPEETSMDEILKVLEELVLKTDPSCESAEPPLLPTDAVTRAAILSHSIAALFGRLERSHAARLGAHVASETSRWMAHMFRLADYSAYYHQEQLEGLVRVTRMLLHCRYPRYLEDGALAFATRLPCIYSCVASPLGVVQHLCRQLGLPLACVRPVPQHPRGRGMDVPALERLCSEDAAAGRAPLLALGGAGAAPLGGGEDLPALAAACRRQGLHLHLRGHGLALPAALPRDESYSIADSVTLTPGPWFGVPGLPTVTFYKIPEPMTANDHSKGVNPAGSREGALAALGGLTGGAGRVSALPLWAALRAAGARALTARLTAAFRNARIARTIVAEAGLKILSAEPGGDEPPTVDLVEAMSRASACVAFQFAPADADKPPPYYDKLNSWLGQVLQREADMISIEVCETESHGVVLRYCPLEGSVTSDLDGLPAILDAQVHVLRATAALREPFLQHVAAIPCLEAAAVPGWAGLGGVRYVPAGWEDTPQRLDALNRQLVEALRATDGAFSCGESADGRACVRFGMVTADTDVQELLELVLLAGKDVEDSSRELTDMTEVLKKGISEAVADLERENALRLWQEGLLRRVPVVGRVVDWWAPAAVPPPPGRRLHLQHGTLQPTSDVYRYIQKKSESEPARAHSPARQPTTDGTDQ